MKIQRYGEDERGAAAAAVLEGKLAGRMGTLHLFPIPSPYDATDAGGAPGDYAAGYAFSPACERALAARGVAVLDVSRDPQFSEENARLTALGTLGTLLTTQKTDPADLSVGIVGYGRIGRELLRLLLFLGARCRVYTASPDKRRELGSFGIESEDSAPAGRGGRFSDLDLLINTAPARLILPEEGEALSSVRVIELASGDNLPPTVRCERLSSVPAVCFPKSAGAVYATAILRMMEESRTEKAHKDEAQTDGTKTKNAPRGRKSHE